MEGNKVTVINFWPKDLKHVYDLLIVSLVPTEKQTKKDLKWYSYEITSVRLHRYQMLLSVQKTSKHKTEKRKILMSFTIF